VSKEETKLTPDEEYEKAFAEATKNGNFSNDDLDEKHSKTTQNEKESQKDQAGDGAQATPQDPEETSADQTPDDDQVSGEAGDKESGKETDWKALYEKEVQRTKSWNGRLQKEAQLRKEAEEKLEEAQKKSKGKAKDVKLPEDEKGNPDLEAFFKEFPELKDPIVQIADQRAKEIARKIVQDELSKIQPQVDTLTQQAKVSADEAHYAAIDRAYPDWRQWAQDGSLEKWIFEQPSILQERLIEITESGTAQEVIALFDQFVASKKPKPKSGRKLPEKAEAAMAVPGSSGGPPQSGPAMDDFDAAWDEAIKS